MSEAVEQLRAARSLLANRAAWTRKTCARDRYGDPVPSAHAEAICWCAYGALERQGASRLSDASVYLRSAAFALFESRPADVNDSRGHPAVLRMYDLAIDLAEAQS